MNNIINILETNELGVANKSETWKYTARQRSLKGVCHYQIATDFLDGFEEREF